MNTVLKSAAILVFTVLNFAINAQSSMMDVVYLKSGSIIRGVIVEQVPNQSLKIETKDRNVFVFKFEEIEKINKEMPSDVDITKNKNLKDKSSGFILWAESQYGIGTSNFKIDKQIESNIGNYSNGFRVVNGYRFNDNFVLGLGIGIDKNSYAALLPITMSGRVYLFNSSIQPILTTNLGYSLSLEKKEGGLIINPELGIKKEISDKINFLFSVGYKWQHLEIFYFEPVYYPIYFGKSNVQLKFFTVSMGLEF